MREAKLQIMGISESRWCGSGKFILSTGETIVYSGRDDDVHQHGVAIMLNKDAAKALINWTPIDERIIRARFHSRYVKLTLIHVYAPTNDTDEEVKDHFYEKLQAIVEKTPKHDLLVITGDLNAKVGSDVEGYERVMGKHGVGTRNDNGEKLCDFCGMNDLVITGTIFPHKEIHKQTWISPDRRTRNQIDHVLINKKFRTSVLDTRAIRSADIASDHHLVYTKLRLKLRAVPNRHGLRRTRYDFQKLENDGCRRRFRLELRNRFEILQREALEDEEEDHPEAELEKANDILEKAYNMTAKKVLGYKKKKVKPWISKESWDLIEQRKAIKLKLDGTNSERLKEKKRAEYKAKDQEVKRQIRRDKRNWTEGIAKEAEEAANKQHMKTLYNLTKTICNDKPKQSTAVNDKNGNTLTNSEDRRKRWREHFMEILNREEPADPINEEDCEQQDIADIDTGPVSKAEIRRAVKSLKNGKAPGEDMITAELLKADLEFTTDRVKDLIDTIWSLEKVPRKWKRGLIIKIPKKGNLKECKNWRGVTLLPVVSKILGRIVIDRICMGIDRRLRKEQAGFRSGRGTTEQIFILRNILEQVNEWQATLYLNFIDFEKAFDSVHRNGLWMIMNQYGIPQKIINIVKALYDGFECTVVEQEATPEWFELTTGVKQGCTMSGFLFLLIIDWIMRHTVKDEGTGLRWKFTSKLEDLDFADDVALISSTQRHVQLKTDRLVENAERTGLRVNVGKCKVMRVNARNNEAITVNGLALEDVEKFIYLGATVCKQGGGEEDIKARLGKARGAFVKLNRVWNSSSVTRKTKIRLYKTLVKPVLMYGCETWKMNEGDAKKIDVFQNRCLRRIMKIKWQDKVTNKELLERANVVKLSEEVRRRRWRFIGHILRQQPDNDCVTALTWTPEGKRKIGRPKTTWRRTVEKERSRAGWKSWGEVRAKAQDRNRWRAHVEALCATLAPGDSN